ncbi:MAG TPA: HD-GYP domain-containing protein [Dehalococcoidia bacterium]|nr:HD-GYP domain-containing protein [Dehalococcoidia bacterium]
MTTSRIVAITVGAALAAPMLALAFFVRDPGADPLWMQMDVHFWVVGVTALAAAVAACVVILSARTLRETRLLFLALAFVCIAGIFSVHGLMTPGYIAHDLYASVPVSGWASIVAGALFIALSATELPQAADRFVRRAGIVIFAWVTVGVGAYLLLSLTVDEWLNWFPLDNRALQYATAFAAMGLIAFAVQRYWQAYQFARLPSQAATTLALALLLEVPPLILWGTPWHLSWWLYHGAYGGAFVVLFGGWAIEVRRAGSLSAIAEALSMRDALAQLNRGRDAQILELVNAIETKDVATLGHVSRVSAHALAIGRQLGLGPQDLRSLVLAAQMHDVGKIGLPDAILMKPGRLTEAEFSEVKRHAPRGGSIARRVAALRPLAAVIRAHHERYNGQGYPDGRAGDAIPFLSRIIAVADTFDAMTSDRPYREALSRDAALAELRRVSGVELDPACVGAFLATFGEGERAAA